MVQEIANNVLVYRQSKDKVVWELQKEVNGSTSGEMNDPAKATVIWFSLNNHLVSKSVLVMSF